MCVVSFDAPTGCLRRKVEKGPGRSHRASRSSRRRRPCGADRRRPDPTQPPRGLFSVPLTYRVPRRPTGNCAPLLCFKQARTADRNFATLRHDTMSSSPRSRTVWHSIRVDIFSAFSLCLFFTMSGLVAGRGTQRENKEQGTGIGSCHTEPQLDRNQHACRHGFYHPSNTEHAVASDLGNYICR